MASRKKIIKYCLRILDVLDIIGLIVLNALAIAKYD